MAEADSLEKYGTAMLALYQGTLTPRDDVESAFVEQAKSGAAGANPHAKVWFKYLKVDRSQACSSSLHRAWRRQRREQRWWQL